MVMSFKWDCSLPGGLGLTIVSSQNNTSHGAPRIKVSLNRLAEWAFFFRMRTLLTKIEISTSH